MTALGIIAGGGELPAAIAESVANEGRAVFVAALRGLAEKHVTRFDHEWVSLGETGRALRALRERGCGDVLLAGKVARPDWADVKFDAKSMLYLPKVMAAALKGDDALLRSFVALFESEGFRVVSVAEAAPRLVAERGSLGKKRPNAQELADIGLAKKVVRSLGALDVGQGAIVAEGLVLAVEAAEGTDAMIARIASLAPAIRGEPGKPKGVLVKARKPAQDGKTDLPVIGVQTVRNCAAVALAGIAVEAGGALIVGKSAVAETADQSGLFVLGFPPNEAS